MNLRRQQYWVRARIIRNGVLDLIYYKMPNVDGDEYIFTIESWGQLTPKEIAVKAIDIYDKELEEFAELVKNIDKEYE